MKTGLVLVVTLCCVLVLGLAGCSSETVEPPAAGGDGHRIVAVLGHVETGPAESSHAAVEAEALREGYTVRTGADSAATLQLADGTLVIVNQDTELKLGAIGVPDGATGTAASNVVRSAAQRRDTADSGLTLVQGEVFVVQSGNNEPGDFTIDLGGSAERRVRVIVHFPTPGGDTPPKSAMSAAYYPEWGLGQAMCVAGSCSLTDGGESIQFGAGETVRMRKLPGMPKATDVTLKMTSSDESRWNSALRFANSNPQAFPVLTPVVGTEAEPFPVDVEIRGARIHKIEGTIDFVIGLGGGEAERKGITSGGHISPAESGKLNALFLEGDSVQTGPGSALTLEMDDGSLVALSQNTGVTLDKLGGTSEEPVNHLALDSGEVVVIQAGSGWHDAELQIRIPNEEVYLSHHPARDGHLAVSIHYDSNTTDLEVTTLHGQTDLVAPDHQPIPLQAGKRTKVEDSHDKYTDAQESRDPAAWDQLAEASTQDMSEGDFKHWLGVLAFAETDAELFPAMEPYVDSEPDPFPVTSPDV